MLKNCMSTLCQQKLNLFLIKAMYWLYKKQVAVYNQLLLHSLHLHYLLSGTIKSNWQQKTKMNRTAQLHVHKQNISVLLARLFHVLFFQMFELLICNVIFLNLQGVHYLKPFCYWKCGLSYIRLECILLWNC